MSREQLEFDVLIVGGGPAGLAAAIRLKQLQPDVSVCLIDKGSEIGAHILSGAVIDPRALDELLPDWLSQGGTELVTPVQHDVFLALGEQKALTVPQWLLPASLHNQGNYIVSLGKLCAWLAQQAEALGVEIYTGFAASELLFNEQGAVSGVVTGDFGRLHDGSPGPRFQPGMALLAKYTLFAEGARGHLGKQLIQHFQLDAGRDPQSYSLGIKELWEVPASQHQAGLVVHSVGWPLNDQAQGGGFLYHLNHNLVAVGLVVGLGYQNPYLSPFEEFQRYKTHPAIRHYLQGGRRLSYGARALAHGGLQALPKLVFPGGALLGDDAGLLNAARIKGSHAAIKSGSLAAEACIAALQAQRQHDELSAYPAAFEQSWLYQELHQSRNFKPWLNKGLKFGALMYGIEQAIGAVPWTLHNRVADFQKLQSAEQHQPIAYPRPDGEISFDRASSVYLSGTQHDHQQPNHLKLADPERAISLNWARYQAPEQRYCPAGVYEIVLDPQQQPRLQINAQNCVHCKSCDIKDPSQNINWLPPQGSDGPSYRGM